MSLAKSSADYPQELVNFALDCQHIQPGWRAVMHMRDSRAAQHWRMLFYGFRKACERDNPQLATWMRPISVAVRGNTIELSHRDGTDLMANMHELALSLPAAPPVSPLPDSAPAPKRETHDDVILRLLGLAKPTAEPAAEPPSDGERSESPQNTASAGEPLPPTPNS